MLSRSGKVYPLAGNVFNWRRCTSLAAQKESQAERGAQPGLMTDAVMFYLKSLGAKSLRSLRHVSHSWAVPGDEKNTYLMSAFSSMVRNDPIAAGNGLGSLVPI